MKYLALSILFLTTISATAGVITCSNNPNSPGQYTDLQLAIDNANSGDTILVSGSLTPYNTSGTFLNIAKPLVLIGAGYNNPNGTQTVINANVKFKQVNPVLSASGSRFYGFSSYGNNMQIYIEGGFSGGSALNQGLSDIIIDRCRTAGFRFSFEGGGSFGVQDGTHSNIIIQNCVTNSISNSIVVITNMNSVYSNCFIQNNVLDHNIGRAGDANLNGFIFRNNIFLDNIQASSIPSAYTSPDLVFENNIFYGVNPLGLSNCTFNNNITYSCINDTLIYSGNPGANGSGNFIGQNPQFVSYTGTGAYSCSHDYHLMVGSPGINAGTDGTNIGIYGGAKPFTSFCENPAIPQVQEVTLPIGSSVSVGTNLNVTVKGYKQD